jgi:hypothetical protein
MLVDRLPEEPGMRNSTRIRERLLAWLQAAFQPVAPGSGWPFENAALTLLIGLVLFFSLFRYGHTALKLAMEAPFVDFAHYYTYATVVAQGRNPFDAEAVARVDEALRIRRAVAEANYPPLFYLLMQPWILLPFRQSALVWLVMNQAWLLAALGLGVSRPPSPTPISVAALLFVVLNYQPLVESLALGQTNVLLLFLVTLAWWGLRNSRPWLTAGGVALTIFVKVQYALLVPWLFWMGRRKAGGRALVLTGVGIGAGLVMLGLEHHLDYLGYLLPPPESLYSWSANLSPLAALFRLFSPSATGRRLAIILALVLDVILLVLFVRAASQLVRHEAPAVDWAWGLGLAAVLLLSPLTEEHHLVVLLLPVMLLVLSETRAPVRLAELSLLVASIVLLGSRYSLARFPNVQQGPLSLLATGKLLGILGVVWLLIRRLRAVEGSSP